MTAFKLKFSWLVSSWQVNQLARDEPHPSSRALYTIANVTEEAVAVELPP